MGIIQRTKELLQRMNIIKGVKDKFSADVRLPDCESFYRDIEYWKKVYTCDKSGKDWLSTKSKSISNPSGKKRTRDELGMAKILCSELAELIFNEECRINVSSDSEQTKKDLQDYVNKALQRGAFWSKFQTHVEYMLALGGAYVKVLIVDGKPTLNYVMADFAVPTGWNERGITEAVFISQEKRDRWYYTLLEWHELKTVTNEEGEKSLHRVIKYNLYRASDADLLGVEVSDIQSIYPDLESPLEIDKDVDTFAHMRPNTANNVDYTLPLGISVFANAVDTIKQLDVAYDSFGREFKLGKKRIIVPSSAIREVTGLGMTKPARYFDADDEAYEAFNQDDRDNLQIQDNTTTLRVEEHVMAINALLNILCMQVGLTPGTFSFDQASGLRTATEIISANSKTYKTIRSHQNLIREAIESVVGSIIDYGQLYKDLPAGLEYEVSIAFDDSIATDSNTEIDNAIKLTTAGLKSKTQAMIDLYGYTEEQAKTELARIDDEQMLEAADIIDMFGREGAVDNG